MDVDEITPSKKQCRFRSLSMSRSRSMSQPRSELIPGRASRTNPKKILCFTCTKNYPIDVEYILEVLRVMIGLGILCSTAKSLRILDDTSSSLITSQSSSKPTIVNSRSVDNTQDTIILLPYAKIGKQ